MKRKLKALSQRYQAALRKHLQRGPREGLQSALALGCQAAALNLETLDMVKIHQGALAALKITPGKDGVIKRAETFFAEAVTPIEKKHRAALETKVRVNKLSQTLSQRTVDLGASHRSLQHGIVQRKAMQQALKKSGQHSRKLLQESRALQQRLQSLTHQILSAQEDKRKKISRDLHNEIAQTLLGINVRLLTLKKEAALNADDLQKEIVSTQRLVDKSVKSIQRFAREFGLPQKT